MKKKNFKRALLICAGFAILSIAAITAFAETATTSINGCPESTGGYKYSGNRSTEYCYQSKTEVGYWWLIGGEVKWVGTVFASMKGEFKKDEITTTYKGQEYRCDGYNYEVCWVCNCYYQNVTSME